MKRHAYLILAMTLGVLPALLLTAPLVSGQASPREDVTQQLEDVMSDPLFSRWELRRARSSTGGPQSFDLDAWLRPYSKRIEDFIDWLFNPRHQTPPPSPTGSGNPGDGGSWFGSLGDLLKFTGWVVLIGTVLLIGWMIFSHWQGGRRASGRSVLDRQALDAALEGADALVAESHVWAEHAQQLVYEDNLRLAFRAMYLALLSGLHQAGKIRYRPQRTNGWYVRGYKGKDDERAIFAGLTERFGEVWYGQHIPDQNLFARVTRDVDGLLGNTSGSQEPAGQAHDRSPL